MVKTTNNASAQYRKRRETDAQEERQTNYEVAMFSVHLVSLVTNVPWFQTKNISDTKIWFEAVRSVWCCCCQACLAITELLIPSFLKAHWSVVWLMMLYWWYTLPLKTMFVLLPTGSTHEVMLLHSREFVGVSVVSVPWRIVGAQEKCSFISSYYGVPVTSILRLTLFECAWGN